VDWVVLVPLDADEAAEEADEADDAAEEAVEVVGWHTDNTVFWRMVDRLA